MAFAAWGEGDLEGASRQLRELSRSPNFNVRYTDFLWLGLIELQRGSCPAAIEYWERARAVRWPPWVGTPAMPPWVGARSAWHPRLLHHLATCYEKVGDLAKARERNDEMLRLWARADPDLPLLVEAKALKARLEGR